MYINVSPCGLIIVGQIDPSDEKDPSNVSRQKLLFYWSTASHKICAVISHQTQKVNDQK